MSPDRNAELAKRDGNRTERDPSLESRSVTSRVRMVVVGYQPSCGPLSLGMLASRRMPGESCPGLQRGCVTSDPVYVRSGLGQIFEAADLREFVRVDARAADQRAVHIGFGHDRGDVLGLH